MAITYNINLTRDLSSPPPTAYIEVDERTVVEQHGLTFIGRGVEDYGRSDNINIIRLAEHFADFTDPPFPVEGQIWYDPGTLTAQVYNGTTFVDTSVDTFILPNTYDVTQSNPANPGGTASLPFPPELELLRSDFASITTSGSFASVFNLGQHLQTVQHPSWGIAHTSISQITFDNSTTSLTSTDALAAMEEVISRLLLHVNSPAQHPANLIEYTGIVGLANNVQEALETLDADITALESDATALENLIGAPSGYSGTSHLSTAPGNFSHRADQIQYVVPPGSPVSVPANNVQQAIERIAEEAALLATPGLSAGLADYARIQIATVTPSSLNPEVWLRIPLSSIVFGDAFSNVNLTTNEYVADRTMTLRIRVFAEFQDLRSGEFGLLRILRNGSEIRRGQVFRDASSAPPTDTDMYETVSVITEVVNGTVIHFEAAVFSGLGTSGPRGLATGIADSGIEIEVLRAS